jgi:hypothetical protein
MTDKTKTDENINTITAGDAHTELRRQADAKVSAGTSDAVKPQAPDLLPDPAPEDTLDDLFNDMPV